MTTEITVSEIATRVLYRLGDLAIEANEYFARGNEKRMKAIMKEADILRHFLTAFNSPYLVWTDMETRTLCEIVATEFDLVDIMVYSLDWLNTFKEVPALIQRDATYVQMPSGTGYVYAENGTLSVDPWVPLTTKDL